MFLYLLVLTAYKKFFCSIQTLSHCEQITDEGIRHIAGGPCAIEHLQIIELDNCPSISDTSLDHLM